MIAISHGRSLRFQIEIEAIARELNRQIAAAASAGMTIEASIVEVTSIGDVGPVPFLDLAVEVRPDQIRPFEEAQP